MEQWPEFKSKHDQEQNEEFHRISTGGKEVLLSIVFLEKVQSAGGRT